MAIPKSPPLSSELLEPIDLGIRYLHKSPVWNPDGSVNAAYVLDRGRYLPEYHEITGYAISMAWLFHDYLRHPGLSADARRAAEYFALLGRQGRRRNGAFPHPYSTGTGKIQDCYFSFDNGIILQALIAHWRRFPQDVELSQMAECALWLVEKMQNPEGSFKAFMDSHGRHVPSSSEFFHDRGCLHAKLAIPLIQMHRLTGLDLYRESAIKVCDWVLGLQDPATGLFWANAARDHVFSHAHAYAVEGLIYACHAYGMPAHLRAVRHAAEALARIQSPSGGIPSHPADNRSWMNRFRLSISGKAGDAVDATAQAVQIWIYLDLLSRGSEFQANIKRAGDWLVAMQIGKDSEDPAAVGAFRPRAAKGIGSLRGGTVLETWASQFAVRALMLILTSGQGRLGADRMMEHWC